jgi:hypothetical protein
VRTCKQRALHTQTTVIHGGPARIANHQSWNQIRRHFDTRRIEEARQVLGGVCYAWQSTTNAGRRWSVIACWQDTPPPTPQAGTKTGRPEATRQPR